jgi:hypothetical protein
MHVWRVVRAAVPGTSLHRPSARPTAAGARPTSGTAVSVSGREDAHSLSLYLFITPWVRIESRLTAALPVLPPPQKEPRAGDLLTHRIGLHRSSPVWIAAAIRHERGLDRGSLRGTCSSSAMPLLHPPHSSGRRSAILRPRRRSIRSGRGQKGRGRAAWPHGVRQTWQSQLNPRKHSEVAGSCRSSTRIPIQTHLALRGYRTMRDRN